MRVPPVFDDKESTILRVLYEEADGTYDSYTLSRKLNPTDQIGEKEALSCFCETRDATERLLVRGFVRGRRERGADGVYFESLKLTAKGERAAIQERDQVEERKKAIAEAVHRSNEVIKEMTGKRE